MDFLTSTELFINDKNPPVYNPLKSFYEQSSDVLEYYYNELLKIRNGVNIGGYFVHPWLYWHINFFKTPIPIPDERGQSSEVIMTPPLDDNFMWIIHNYQKAEKENKGMALFGCRGSSKALKNDEVLLYEDGWKPIGDAKVGDRIYGGNGKLTTILGVYPQGKVDLYKVTLRDGRSIVCCDEHLWYVRDEKENSFIYNLKTLRKKIHNGGNFKIPYNNDLKFLKKYDLPTIKISHIEYVGKDEATCIKVDNNDKLFITTDYIVTHNSTALSSLSSWLTTTKENGTVSVVGGSDVDLKEISKLLKVSFNNVHPAMFIPQLVADWDKKIDFGLREKSGYKMEFSHMKITNRGNDKASEKGAGGSPVGFIADEIGKWKCVDIIQSALASFKTQYGSKLVHVLAGTSGNKELSQDAKKILQNPSAFDLIDTDWDRLDMMTKSGEITWEKSKKDKFSVFFPGQMSYRLEVPKVETNLAEFLNVDSPVLSGIKMFETNWEEATNLIKTRNVTAPDSETKQKNQMYYPLDLDDVWLTESRSPFPKAIIQNHLRKLKDLGKYGTPVELYKEDGKTKFEFSDKQVAPTYYNGELTDSPIVIYGSVPETPPDKYTFVAGLDHYKLDGQAQDGSFGAYYILKRRSLEPNESCEKIVGSYVGRPQGHREFNAMCLQMMQTWNAMTNLESIDLSYQQYLKERNIDHDYLCESFRFSGAKEHRQKALNSEYGLYPTAQNNKVRMNFLYEWCREEHIVGFNENGEKIFKYGVEFIEDIELLQEMLDYNDKGNFDRIAAFSHALIYAAELDKKLILPEKPRKKIPEQYSQSKPRNRSPFRGRGRAY